jgi:hypothetical protein
VKRHVLVLAAVLIAAAGCSTSAPPPNPSPPTAVASPPPRADGAPSARDVVDAFAAAGLPVPGPRDNSGGCTTGVGCAELVTTDAISVYVFPDEESAAAFADAAAPDAHRAGVVVLGYAAARTPPADRPAYENTLTGLL